MCVRVLYTGVIGSDLTSSQVLLAIVSHGKGAHGIISLTTSQPNRVTQSAASKSKGISNLKDSESSRKYKLVI